MCVVIQADKNCRLETVQWLKHNVRRFIFQRQAFIFKESESYHLPMRSLTAL